MLSNSGRFLKRDKEGSWCTIGHEEAVLKTSQALRDARRILLREREQGQSENNNKDKNKGLTDSTVTASSLTDSTFPASSNITVTSEQFIDQDREALEVANSLYQLSLGNFGPS